MASLLRPCRQGQEARVSINKKSEVKSMAEVKLYSIRDLVAGECGPIFTAKNDGVAIRQVCAMMHDVVDVADYALYCVGTFDIEEMVLVDKTPYEIDFHFLHAQYSKKIEEIKARQTYISEVKS